MLILSLEGQSVLECLRKVGRHPNVGELLLSQLLLVLPMKSAKGELMVLIAASIIYVIVHFEIYNINIY